MEQAMIKIYGDSIFQQREVIINFQYQIIDRMSENTLKDRTQQFTRKKIQCYSYGLNDQIGKGYSSKVYRGRNDDTNQPVAVKVIDLKLLKNQINRTLLDAEIDILKELKDVPNVLNVHDVFTTKNNTYIITELCHSDLSKRIKQSLIEPQVINLMQQIIRGYLNFQKRGIVHRDLKPANLLVTEDGQLKIADFGFGIRVQNLGKSNKYNVGSPLYMAPESLRKNQYSFKSDIWALGIIFYEMLLCDTPWRAKNQKDLLRRIQSETIQSIISTKNISSISKQFLVRTLRLDKHRRMSPEQLQQFTFDQSTGNILAEKSLNATLKTPLKPQEFIINSPSCSLRARVQKSIDKPHFVRTNSKPKVPLKHISTNQSLHLQNIENSTHMQSPEDYRKEKNGDRTARIDTARSEALNRENRKLISKILISQVHFCRFLFKLMQKMRQSSKIGLLTKVNSDTYEYLMRNYAGIIKHKIQQLNHFDTHNYINCQGYNQYKLSSDYQKLMKISKEYNDRYQVEMQRYWNEPYQLCSQPTNAMIRQLYETLSSVVSKMDNPEEQISLVSKDVVILDYLITSHQLIEMVRNNPNGYQRFARKSRIEEIVEGKTVDIHYELYRQIMDRVNQIMQKKQFMSFAGEVINSAREVLI